MAGEANLPGFQMLQPRNNPQAQLAIAAAGWPAASNTVAPPALHYPVPASAQQQQLCLPPIPAPQQQLCLPPIPAPAERRQSIESLATSDEKASPSPTPGKSVEDLLDQEVDKAGAGSAMRAPVTASAALPGGAVAKAEPAAGQPKPVGGAAPEVLIEDENVDQMAMTKAKVSARDALEKLDLALKKRDGDGSTGSGAGGDGKNPAEKKKPVQPKTANMKKPASNSIKAKAKPTQPTIKRPAGKVTTSGSSSKGVMTKKEALRLMPGGCTSCRQVPGCTRSCWKKRKYEPNW